MKRTESNHLQTQTAARAVTAAEPRTTQSLLRCGILAMGLLVASSLVPARAFGDDRKTNQDPPPPPPQSPPTFFGGDETIGTLPILQGPDAIELRRNLVIHEPSLCLEGDLTSIMNSVAFTRGSVIAQIVSTDARTGRVRVVFPGALQIGFDRLLIESSSIRVGLWTPGRAMQDLEAVWGTRRGMVDVNGPFSDLPILSMSTTGALSYSPLLLMAHGAGSWTSLLATTTADFLIVRQAH